MQRHYRKLERIEALINLRTALRAAEEQSERDPSAGLPAPRPYPSLVWPGRKWIVVRRYWIAYGTEAQATILAVFDATADIPGRA